MTWTFMVTCVNINHTQMYLYTQICNYREFKFCYIILTPEHAVDLLLRHPGKNSTFAVGSKLHKNSILKNISEPIIPRVVVEDIELSSDISMLEDVSLELKIARYPTNNSCEVTIHSSTRYSIDLFSSKSDLSKYALDFVLDTHIVPQKTHLLFHNTMSRILLLKSNTKIIDPNISLKVNIAIVVDTPAIGFITSE